MELVRALMSPGLTRFLDRGRPDKATKPNEAFALSRITQNDQIGLLEPGWGYEVRNRFACGSALACGCRNKSCCSPYHGRSGRSDRNLRHQISAPALIRRIRDH